MARKQNPYMAVARQLKPVLAQARETAGLSSDRGFRRRDDDGNILRIGYRVKHVKAHMIPDEVVNDPNAVSNGDGKLVHDNIYLTNQYVTFAAVETPGTSKIEVIIEKVNSKTGKRMGKIQVVDTVIVGNASYEPENHDPVSTWE